MTKKRTVAQQNAKNRADGSRYESAVRDYLRLRGLEAEGLRKAGKYDEGDVGIRDKVGWVSAAELKAGKNIRLRYWWEEEAVPEARNFSNKRSLLEPVHPALILKSHNKPVKDSLVVISLETYATLLGGSA